MKTWRRLVLPGLLLVAALALASCGGSGGSGGASQGDDMQGTDRGGQTTAETTDGEMSGMDSMGGTTGGMRGMDQGSASPEEMARQLVAPNGEYSDAAFVDAMIPHHEGAVEMAEVALDNA